MWWDGLLTLAGSNILPAAEPGVPDQTPAAAQNVIGRQSQNVGMPVTPAPGQVTIDSDLSDWDWSGRIWVFADIGVRSRYSVEAAAM